MQRPGRAALAEHLGRHALADLALGVAVFEQQVVGVRVHVDEAGRDDQPLGVDLALGLARRHAADGDDPVAADGHVADEPRVAGAVDDAAVADDEVVLAAHVVAGGEEQEEERESVESHGRVMAPRFVSVYNPFP